jgi:tetratricopeptide (TPR) repeat protein
MTDRGAENVSAARAKSARRTRARDAALALVVAAGLACVFLLSRRLDAARPAEDPFASYEELYVTPEAARRMSLAFNGLGADWYWLRSLQYLGRKSAAFHGDYTLDDMSTLGVRNLGPLLEQATALDPQFMAAYEFGAVVLPAVDDAQAVRFVERGIRENPQSWRLYQHLGYIHWQAGRYAEASDAYRAGARLHGAPGWLEAMAAQVQVYGGSRDTARQLYRRMLDEADDEQIKLLAYRRLLQVQSLDERDAIRRALHDVRGRTSRCPATWREAAPALRAARLKTDAAGSPLDPTGLPYHLDADACEARLNERSQIPKK